MRISQNGLELWVQIFTRDSIFQQLSVEYNIGPIFRVEEGVTKPPWKFKGVKV